jgi:hypothetical protein
MKTNWIVLAAAVVMTASTSFAGGGVNIGVYIGGPAPVYAMPAPVYVQPAPVYVQPAPVYVQPGRVIVGGGYYGGRAYRGPRYVAAPVRVWVPGYWMGGNGKGKGHNKRYVQGYWRNR